MSSYNVTSMCVFKAHCLVLDNPNDVFFPVFSGRVLSLAPSFTQLPEVLCIGLRPPGSFSFVLLHVCKSRRIRDFSVRWCLHSNIRSYTHKVSLSFCFFFFWERIFLESTGWNRSIIFSLGQEYVIPIHQPPLSRDYACILISLLYFELLW